MILKKLFILSLGIFIVLFAIYMFKDKDIVTIREYQEDNIDIVYPFFKNNKINEYINDYLTDNINDFKGNKNTTFYMDYDYFEDGNNINLTFYKYVTRDNVIKETKDMYLINLKDITVSKNMTTVASNYIYDNYYQMFIDKSKPMIALTFDDGPNYNTSKIIDLLNKYNVKATFFLLGKNVYDNQDIVKKMDYYGMEIGNHTYSHKLLVNLSKEQIEGEFSKTDDLIFSIIGKYPTLTRPSYGSTSSKIRSSVDTPIIIWDIDTMDWKYHNSNRIYNKVIDQVSDGDIILMHDIYSATYNSLELIIPELLEKGYQLVTVSELFYYKGITLEDGKVYGLAK